MISEIRFKRIREILICTFILSMAFTQWVRAGQEGQIHIYHEGKLMAFYEAEPFIDENDRTLVPVRFLSEQLNKNVTWDEKNQQVTIQDDETKITMTINKNYLSYNGERIYFDSKPVMIENRTFLPLRFTCELLGYEIGWDNNNKAISIEKSKSEKLPLLEMRRPKFISHAGGRIHGETYTNSLDSFKQSLDRGLNYIEVDISLTTDDEYVLIHSWHYAARFFPAEKKRYSLEEFIHFPMMNDMGQMTLENLMNWLIYNEGTYIITDTKEDNMDLLRYIKQNYAHLMDRLIPQVYDVSEYYWAKDMGYKNVIFTVYKTNITNEELLLDLKYMQLFAVTMPTSRVESGLAQMLDEYGIFTYCHTINDLESVRALKNLGIDGFYTDDLF